MVQCPQTEENHPRENLRIKNKKYLGKYSRLYLTPQFLKLYKTFKAKLYHCPVALSNT